MSVSKSDTSFELVGPSTSSIDGKILRAAARRGRQYLILGQDEDWLREFSRQPRLQLSRMARRQSLFPLGGGRFVIAPMGAKSLQQAAPFNVLLQATLEGRSEYYLGFLSALIEHGLTDLDSPNAFVALKGGKGVNGSSLEVAGRTVYLTRITKEEAWFGVERVRAQGRTFYHRSNVERTLIDTLSRPALCAAPEVWVRSWGRAFRRELVDVEKLSDYARLSESPVALRCAYWLRALDYPAYASQLVDHAGRDRVRALLDPAKTYDMPPSTDPFTGLKVNLPERAVRGWLSYGK